MELIYSGSMRILVVSDTHRKDDLFYKLIKESGKLDMVIHCGDTEGGECVMENACDCPFVCVCGNNDFFSYSPKECELELEGHKLFVTHGHFYGVSKDNRRITDEAKARGCDIVLFGHTHVPELEERRGITLLNPGSLSYPRQADRNYTYAIMELKPNCKPEIQFKSIERDTYF